jgi:serpin B
MVRIARIGLFILVVVSMLRCSTPGQPRDQVVLAQSDKSRETAPQASDTDLSELVKGNSAFALTLYQHLSKQTDTNLFYSPYSLSLALAMAYAGARGETEEEIAQVLHFIPSQERLHPAFNALDLELAKRGEDAKEKDDQGFRLSIVNAIWGQAGYEFLPEFLDLLAQNYGAGMRLLDFVKDAEAARKIINSWVAEETGERIKDLIPAGMLNVYTRLVLTNAIYFNAAWSDPFEASRTRDGAFTKLDGTIVHHPMISQSATYGYYQGQGYQAVELLYEGEELSLVILLPDAGTFADFESNFSTEHLMTIAEQLDYVEVVLTMPKFTIESGFSLVDVLGIMGMPTAFSEAADFSGIDATQDLFISNITHKAFISVDEAGTEAAAATAITFELVSAPIVQVKVNVDRPFIFLIRDIQTNTVLFIGRVLNPTL